MCEQETEQSPEKTYDGCGAGKAWSVSAHVCVCVYVCVCVCVVSGEGDAWRVREGEIISRWAPLKTLHLSGVLKPLLTLWTQKNSTPDRGAAREKAWAVAAYERQGEN